MVSCFADLTSRSKEKAYNAECTHMAKREKVKNDEANGAIVAYLINRLGMENDGEKRK